MNENREETHLGMQLESQQNKKAKRSYRSVCLTLVAVLIIAIICMTGCKRRTNDDEPTTTREQLNKNKYNNEFLPHKFMLLEKNMIKKVELFMI